MPLGFRRTDVLVAGATKLDVRRVVFVDVVLDDVRSVLVVVGVELAVVVVTTEFVVVTGARVALSRW